MEGRSHLLVGLTAGVVLDSFVHLTGDPLTMAKTVTLAVLVKKAIYYLMVGFAVLFGCIMHIAADALTEGGVPLLWPNHKRFGFPPNPNWRFRTGTWPEFAIVWGFMILVGVGIWQTYIVI